MVRVADYIIDFLADRGIKCVYTITGWGTLYLTDALARTNRLETICMHNEQAVSYAAYGYSRGSDNIGACVVSAGCAGTNAITGVMCAWQDGVPCVFLSGQNKHTETSYFTGQNIRTYGSQENNIVSIVKPITKYAVMLTRGEDIAYELEKAYSLATGGRKGPVWIDIPIDIQNARIDENNLKHYSEENTLPKANEANVIHSLNMLRAAKRPVILIGSGVKAAKCENIIEHLAEKYSIPIICSPSAVDILDNTQKYVVGAMGSHGGCRAANFTVQNADYILAVGTRLSAELIGEPYERFAREAKKVVIDIDQDEHNKGIIQYDLFIHSDAKDYLVKLSDLLMDDGTLDFVDWMQIVQHWKDVFPRCPEKYQHSELIDLHNLGRVLSKQLPDNGSILTDAGLEELIIPPMLELNRTQKCIHPYSQGAMGFSLPAAIGVYGATGACVITVNGDGSVMMNIQELQTISYNNLPIKIVICNNNMYAIIRKRQKDLFRTRTIGTNKENGVAAPNYEQIAKAFNIPYFCITSTDMLEDGIKKMIEAEGPVIVEVMCVQEQEYLHNSYVISKTKKVERRSLEDQSPFIDRELFKTEMIVEPIDFEG